MDYLDFGQGQVHWMPVVFSESGVPLMLCNAQYANKISFSMVGKVSYAAAAPHMLVPWGGLGVFRRPDLITTDRRVVAPSYLRDHETTRLRLQLFEAVDAAGEIICNSLDVQGLSNQDFWEMTVDNVYRINLTSGGPVVREFTLAGTDPLVGGPAPPPTTLDSREFKKLSIVRCLHRLINTRVMRAMLALAGAGDFDTANVVGLSDWDLVAPEEFRGAELTALRKHFTGEEARSVQGPDWWAAPGPGGRRSRQAGFPHMSQRPLWTTGALQCALGPIGTADGAPRSLVEGVARHVQQCLQTAIALGP